MKKYFFLSGIPRSGNTLLSSILNQNPDIKVSANSFLNDHLYQTAMFFHSEKYKNFPDEKSLNNLLASSFDSYYKDWDAKYIIDRGPWGTPINIALLSQYLNNEIKVICPVRDINQVIASFIRISPERWQHELDLEIQNGMRFNQSYKTMLEIICEVIMRPNGQVENALFSLHNLFTNHKDLLHLVEYDDLVNDTENTIREIYNFLNMDYYPHNFSYIHQFERDGLKYEDSIWGANIHKLGKKIRPPKYNIEDVLTKDLIEKYSNLEFWRR